MARKRRWKKEGKVYNNPGDADPTTRSISVFENLVAVSAGKRWRVAEIGCACVVQPVGSKSLAAAGWRRHHSGNVRCNIPPRMNNTNHSNRIMW